MEKLKTNHTEWRWRFYKININESDKKFIEISRKDPGCDRLYKNNNWKAIQGNSIKVLYNGLKRIKHKKPSSLKVYHKISANTFIHIMTGEKIIIK